jgi:hypothetical protein
MPKPAHRPLGKIHVIENPDKLGHEEWTDERAKKDIGNFPSPSRFCITADVGRGKTNLIKHLIMSQDPPFREVFLCHPDTEISKEYDDLEPTDMLDYIPGLDYFDFENDTKPTKRALIIDDWEVSKCKEEQKNLGILMRYASSHRGLTIYYAHQSYFNIPPIVRKMSNVFIVYKPKARNELAMIENRVGVEKDTLKQMFKTVANGHYDSICIDLTKNSPAKFRLNVWEPITDDDDSDESE